MTYTKTNKRNKSSKRMRNRRRRTMKGGALFAGIAAASASRPTSQPINRQTTRETTKPKKEENPVINAAKIIKDFLLHLVDTYPKEKQTNALATEYVKPVLAIDKFIEGKSGDYKKSKYQEALDVIRDFLHKKETQKEISISTRAHHALNVLSEAVSLNKLISTSV
jgi:hypothetical protein